MLVMGAIYGVIRIIGAIGLWKIAQNQSSRAFF